jgi:micrococcal nuclease
MRFKKKMNLILLILLILPLNSFAEDYDYKIIRVIDGDTIVIEAPYLPKPLKKEISLRIVNTDTPELHKYKCELEYNLASEAKEFTQDLIKKAKEKSVLIQGEDKYFRLLGDVVIDGKLLSNLLLESGYAKPYKGSKKQSWCD